MSEEDVKQPGEAVASEQNDVALAPKAGDVCEENGVAGVLQADAGGHLVCVPNEIVEQENVDSTDGSSSDESAKEAAQDHEAEAVNGARHNLA